MSPKPASVTAERTVPGPLARLVAEFASSTGCANATATCVYCDLPPTPHPPGGDAAPRRRGDHLPPPLCRAVCAVSGTWPAFLFSCVLKSSAETRIAQLAPAAEPRARQRPPRRAEILAGDNKRPCFVRHRIHAAQTGRPRSGDASRRVWAAPRGRAPRTRPPRHSVAPDVPPGTFSGDKLRLP